MKTLRHIGSLAFVLGLFTVVFAGIPWYVIVPDPTCCQCISAFWRRRLSAWLGWIGDDFLQPL